MAEPTRIPDPADSWSEVELFRWQHGHLPGEQGTDPRKKLDPVAGLRAMAAAFEQGKPQSEWPDPFNVKMVLQHAAKLLEAKTARVAETEDLLTSARLIAERRGFETAWARFAERLEKAGIGNVTAKTFRVLPSDAG